MGIIENNRMIKGADDQTKGDFAQTLKKYRLEHNLSQEELAKLIGTTVFTINRWERAKHYPPQSTLKLLKLLGIL
jgi:DNA-binding transcriptional regulator YiaG